MMVAGGLTTMKMFGPARLIAPAPVPFTQVKAPVDIDGLKLTQAPAGIPPPGRDASAMVHFPDEALFGSVGPVATSEPAAHEVPFTPSTGFGALDSIARTRLPAFAETLPRLQTWIIRSAATAPVQQPDPTVKSGSVVHDGFVSPAPYGAHFPPETE